MKKLLVFLCAMFLVFGMLGIANATLYDRGGGLIYDDVLNITWLQEPCAEYDPYWSWYEVMNWVENLEYYDSARNTTWTNWRLPSALDADGRQPDYIWFDTETSEFGHLYSADGIHRYVHDPFIFNTTLFWTSTTPSYPFDAWNFSFDGGTYDDPGKRQTGIAGWAVMDGDVAPVPEPTTMLLLCSGLIGIVGFRRKFKK